MSEPTSEAAEQPSGAGNPSSEASDRDGEQLSRQATAAGGEMPFAAGDVDDDPDSDPDSVNPRDLRHPHEWEGDPDADPENLNPRDLRHPHE